MASKNCTNSSAQKRSLSLYPFQGVQRFNDVAIEAIKSIESYQYTCTCDPLFKLGEISRLSVVFKAPILG